MPASPNPASLSTLRSAFQQGNLTLYLGAGVSIGSGLPGWNQLVLAMYFAAVHGDWRARWRPYPNYLYAIAEWQLTQNHEPLEITARKIRQFYSSDEAFLGDLKETLYAGFALDHVFGSGLAHGINCVGAIPRWMGWRNFVAGPALMAPG